MNIRTILFDLDGTLIDTNELIIDSFLYTFKQFGYNVTREQCIGFNGPSLEETFKRFNSGQVEAMLQTYRAYNSQHHDDLVKPFPKVKATIEYLTNKGIKVGIVSTKMRISIERGLKVAHLENLFQTIVALDDVKHAKPHPEPVLKGMNALAGIPTTTLMIGDNYHDIEAGHRAGVKTAGVAWSYKGSAFLQKYNPTYMLKQMDDLLNIVGV